MQGDCFARCGMEEFEGFGVEQKSFAAGTVDVVTDLTANRMVWTAKDNSEDVSVYVRADIPEGFKPVEE